MIEIDSNHENSNDQGNGTGASSKSIQGLVMNEVVNFSQRTLLSPGPFAAHR